MTILPPPPLPTLAKSETELSRLAADRHLPTAQLERWRIWQSQSGQIHLPARELQHDGTLGDRSGQTRSTYGHYRSIAGGTSSLVFAESHTVPQVDHLWVCEGCLDAVTLDWALDAEPPDDWVIAVAGTSVLTSQALTRFIVRCQPKQVSIVADNDEPGQAAALKQWRQLSHQPDLTAALRIVAPHTDGADISDYWTAKSEHREHRGPGWVDSHLMLVPSPAHEIDENDEPKNRSKDLTDHQILISDCAMSLCQIDDPNDLAKIAHIGNGRYLIWDHDNISTPATKDHINAMARAELGWSTGHEPTAISARSVGDLTRAVTELTQLPNSIPDIHTPTDRITGEQIPGLPASDGIWSLDADLKLVRQTHERRVILPRGVARISLGTAMMPEHQPKKLIEYLTTAAADDSDLVSFICAQIGRTLLADRPRPGLALLVGPGGTGKSTLLNLLAELVGSNLTTSASIPQMSSKFWLATNASGRQLLIMPEIGQRPYSGQLRAKYDQGLQLIKSLTGGDGDTYTTEAKYATSSPTLNPQITVWGASNYLPAWISGADDVSAYERRLRPIPMTVVIPAHEQNPHLIADIIEADGYEAIAAYCAQSYRTWLSLGSPLPDASAALLERLITEALTPQDDWARQHLQKVELSEVAGIDCYQHFAAWMEQHHDVKTDEDKRSWQRKLRKAASSVAAEFDAPARSSRRDNQQVYYWAGLKLIK